ncbi:MAG: class I SAM-dependent DNA methyltransferase, partial [Bacillota bacterium]
APVYEASMDDALLKQILYTIRPYLKGRVLDLGAGTAALSRAVRPFVNEVEACDIDERVLDEAKRLAQEENLDITFFEHDMNDPLPKTYDVILATLDVFNHAKDFDHFARAFNHAIDGLESGGRLVFDILRCDYIKQFKDFSETLETPKGPIEWTATLEDTPCTVVHTLVFEGERATLRERSYPEKDVKKLFKKRRDLQAVVREVFEDRILYIIKKD